MRMTLGRRASPSDLTDAQWEILAALIPEASLEGGPHPIGANVRRT